MCCMIFRNHFTFFRNSSETNLKKELGHKSILHQQHQKSTTNHKETPYKRVDHLGTDNLIDGLTNKKHIYYKSVNDDTKSISEEKIKVGHETETVRKEIGSEIIKRLKSIMKSKHHNTETSNRNENIESMLDTVKIDHQHHIKQGLGVRYY